MRQLLLPIKVPGKDRKNGKTFKYRVNKRCLKVFVLQKIFGLVFKDNDAANNFWESRGYTIRSNLYYRNKSMNEKIPAGE